MNPESRDFTVRVAMSWPSPNGSFLIEFIVEQVKISVISNFQCGFPRSSPGELW